MCDASLTWAARLNAAGRYFSGRYMDNAAADLFAQKLGSPIHELPVRQQQFAGQDFHPAG
jgi:hypothetical protein